MEWYQHSVAADSGQLAVKNKRVAARRRVLKTGYIIISDKAPKIECTIRNVSDTGASLQVSTTIGIPSSFDVIIDGARRHCRSVWRTDTKIGIAFQWIASVGGIFHFKSKRNVCFSNRPFGVNRFQTIHHHSVDHGLI